MPIYILRILTGHDEVVTYATAYKTKEEAIKEKDSLIELDDDIEHIKIVELYLGDM